MLIIREDIHYRLPLRLINSYIWASLIPPAKAILPVLGVFANKDGKAWPGVKLIAKYAGYKDLRYIRSGMKDLIGNKVINRKKQGRHYIYFLTDIAIWKRGRSYFPIYKNMILKGTWAKLTSSEKSLYIVLGEKAKVNDPDITGSDLHASGYIKHINKYCKFAGISRWSLEPAYLRLNNCSLINFWEDEDIYTYGIYTPQ